MSTRQSTSATLVARRRGHDPANGDPDARIDLHYTVQITQHHDDEWGELLDTIVTAADRIGYLNDSVNSVEITLTREACNAVA